MVGGVGDRQEAVGAEAVGEEVVEHAAVLAAQHAVLGAADRELVDVVGEQALQQLAAPAAPLVSISPMCETSKTPQAVAHGEVLVADPAVLDRHLPAREGHELGARATWRS